MRRSVHIGFSLLTVLVLLIATAGTSSAHQDGMHILKIKAAKGGKPHGTNNLFSHGGAIEQTAKVYIVYWGSDWGANTAARSYIEGFFNGVGGSGWANSTTQYCQGVPSGTVQCGTAGVHPTNPGNELNGHVWNDTSGYFDGFSIVGGHEYAETITDPYPNSGWLDGRGAENGDKCAWISSGQGAAANISLGGNNYAVQSLWSNAFNGGSGGCVLSY